MNESQKPPPSYAELQEALEKNPDLKALLEERIEALSQRRVPEGFAIGLTELREPILLTPERISALERIRARGGPGAEAIQVLLEAATDVPTRHAYDAACTALWKHRERADEAEGRLQQVQAEAAALRKALRAFFPDVIVEDRTILSPEERAALDVLEAPGPGKDLLTALQTFERHTKKLENQQAHIRQVLENTIESRFEDAEVKRIARYLLLLLDGMSDYEARGIVWPERHSFPEKEDSDASHEG
jgi:hypothetical protein